MIFISLPIFFEAWRARRASARVAHDRRSMSLGAVTLAALAVAIVLSCTSRLNVELLALALAWVIGVYVGDLPLRDVTAGFPIDLFLTLSGVTLLFAQAHVNGTLDIVAHNAMRLCRGRVGLVPIMYFALGARSRRRGRATSRRRGSWRRWRWRRRSRCAFRRS